MQNQNPTRAKARLTFYDLSDPTDYISALFNPSSLQQKISARAADPTPVGFPEIPQYEGPSGFEPFDIVLEFSERRYLESKRFGGAKDRWDSRDEAEMPMAERWFISKTHPRGYGIAAGRVVVVWPNTYSGLISVRSVTRSVTRWDANLEPRAGSLAVTVKEHVNGLRTGSHIMREGVANMGLGGVREAFGQIGVDPSVGAVALGIGGSFGGSFGGGSRGNGG